MRAMLLLVMLSATLAHAAWNDYVEARDLRLDASGLDELAIDAGAGSLEIRGDDRTDEIFVSAKITVPGAGADEAQSLIEDHLVLALERVDGRAVLNSYFSDEMPRGHDGAGVGLEVRVPASLALDVRDGSGSLGIRDVRADIRVEDGSGSITLDRAGGDVEIDDGSGSITVDDVAGSIRIVDGSGSILVRRVAGSVTIDDGSGSVDVRDVDADLVIEDDGSGSLKFANIGGTVVNRD